MEWIRGTLICYTFSRLPKLLLYFGFFGSALRRCGLRATAEWTWRRFRQLKGSTCAEERRWIIRPAQAKYPLTVRLAKTSDLRVFEQVFLLDEYSCLRDIKDVLVVLDLGANVGFSSAYLLSSFPQARMVAVEPDSGNSTVCAANLAPYGGRATLMRGAVWSRRTKLRIAGTSQGNGNEWGRQMEEPLEGPAEVEAWDIGSLLDINGFKKADLIKIDIEGAEIAIFGYGADTAWLLRTRNICIELHGQECKDAFFRALGGFDYKLSYSNELTICRDLRPK